MCIFKFLRKDIPSEPRIAIFTRMSFNEKISLERISIYREIFLKSLKNQICRDFDVYVITGGIWSKKSLRENEELIKSQDTGWLNIFYMHLNDLPKHKYNIQIRVDCDDYLAPEFILKCMDIYKNTNKDCFLITFRPYKYDYFSGKLYKLRKSKWTRTPSMFTALCQKTEIRHFIHEHRHTKLKKITRNTVYVQDGLCLLTVHGDNRQTHIQGTDIYVCNGKVI